MIIAELKIPQMFTAYAEDLGYLQNGLHHYQYFCEECDQAFAAAWGKIANSMSMFERGSHFICPECRTHHHKNVAYIDRGELTPNKMRLVIKEYKEVVTLEVSSETVYFNDYFRLNARNYKEVYRFDIAKQTVLYTATDRDMLSNGKPNNPINIGSPFNLEIFNASILRFFTPKSLANTNCKKDLNWLLKVLRETVHRKLEKQLGYKVASMYVSPGECNGTFLLPIFNIAYRVACPDAPNLPENYRYTQDSIERYWREMMITKFDYFESVAEQTRHKKDFVTALIKSHKLPNKPLIRRLMAENPFGIKMLAKSFGVCENYDFATNLYQSLIKYPVDFYRRREVSEELFIFLKIMKPIYGPEGIIRLVADAKELNTADCINLYKHLNTDNKIAIKTEGVKLKDLHNWMSLKHKLQTHKNMRYDIPEHINKRLSMQTDRLKFFLPQESMELLAAGHELHNCVASYGNAIKDKSKWIVLVADDKGKLAACLEIKDKDLVQAKLDKNRPVHCDDAVNAAIMTWAKGAGIQIKTSDIKVPEKKKAKKSIPA